MEAEIPKKKQIIIERILNKKIGLITKAFLLKNDPDLDRDVITDYLIFKNIDVIRDYLKHPEQFIPPARSASEWSDTELDYYLIREPIPVGVEVMFGSKKEILLPEKVQKFLKFNNDELLENYTSKASDKLPLSKFAALYCSYFEKPAYEARVDNIITYFFQKIFGKEFLVEFQVPFDLYVNNSNKDAIADIALSDIPLKKCQGLIVVEDKTSKNVTGNHVAQMIAEGIAVAQQKEWKELWPVYMVGVVGMVFNIYKAIFSKELLNNVQKGINCYEATKILKLSEKINLEHEIGREKLAKILTRIKDDLKTRL